MSTLTERLEECMDEAGISSQAEVSRVSGVPAPTINQWLKGKATAMSGDYLLKISKMFNVNPYWMLYGDGKKRLASTSDHSLISLERLGAILEEVERASIYLKRPLSHVERSQLVARLYASGHPVTPESVMQIFSNGDPNA